MANCGCGNQIVDCGPGCGCGCVCLTEDPEHCWFLCNCPGHDPIIMGPEEAQLSVIEDPPIKMCVKGFQLEALAVALSRVCNEELYVPASRLRETIDTEFTGRLTEVLDQCGLRTALHQSY